MFYRILLITFIFFAHSIQLMSEGNSSYNFEFLKILNNNNFKNAELLILDTINQSNNNNKVLYFSQQYFNLVTQKKLTSKLPLALKQVGNAYRVLSINDSATQFLFHAYSEAQTQKDTLTMIESSIYLGLIYSRYYDWKMVEKHYLKAYLLAKEFRRPFEIASASWNLAWVNAETKKFNISFSYAQESLRNLNLINDKNTYHVKFGYSLAYYYYGSYFQNKSQFDSANFYFRKSIDFSSQINNHNLLAPANVEIARDLNSEGIIDKLPLAIYHAQKCLESAEIINDFYFLESGYEQKYLAYEKLGKTDSAFISLMKFKQYSDSMHKYDARIMAAKNELVLSENEFRRKEELNHLQNKYTVIILIAVIIALIFVFLFLYNRYKLKNKLNQQLAETNSTKDRFFSIISHDLRSPISSIFTLADLVEKHYTKFSKEEMEKFIGNLRSSSENLMNLTENLLLWSQINTNKIQPILESIDISNIIQTEISNFQNELKSKNIEVENNVSTVQVFADSNMASSIVRNLLHNAIKFSYSDSKILISTTISGKFLKITIKDYGVGIEDRDLDSIFRYDKKISHSGTKEEKGSGLGLNICKEFVAKNGGSIGFESQVGKGSEFYFTLPLFV